MPLDEVTSLRDPDLSDGAGKKANGKKAKESNGAQESSGAERKGLPRPMLFFLAVSPVVIFGTVWLTLSRMPISDSDLPGADSLAVIPDSLAIAVRDTAAQAPPPPVLTPEQVEAQELAEVDAALADTSGGRGYYLNARSEQMKLLEAMARLRDRISQKNAALQDLEQRAEERDALAMELQELKDKNAAQEARLQYLEKSMPDNIVKKLREYDTEKQTVRQQQGTTQAQASEDKLAQMRRLSKIYSDMKPAEAAPILEQLKVEDVTMILQGMRSRSAAKIMAQFKPAFSAKISQRMGSVK